MAGSQILRALAVLLLALLPGSVVCTRCSLSLVGDSSNGSFIPVANLVCKEGPDLAAAADPRLLERMHALGVEWKATGACNSLSSTCLLSICNGAEVVFDGASIQGLNLIAGHVLCLAANSTVTITNSLMAGNTAAMIHAQDASLTIINTTIKDNACSQPAQGRTGVTVAGQNSTLHIEGSSFVNNTATKQEAPALYITGRTKATITATTFHNNSVQSAEGEVGAVGIMQNAIGGCRAGSIGPAPSSKPPFRRVAACRVHHTAHAISLAHFMTGPADK